MAAPPAKRQKRQVVLSSDEEKETHVYGSEERVGDRRVAKNHAENGTGKQSLPSRPHTKPTSITAKTKPVASPKKIIRTSKLSTEKHTSKPISKFFSATTEGLIPRHHESRAETPQVEDEVEDAIEDDSPKESLEQLRGSQNKTRLVLDRRKRPGEEKLPTGSQRFKLAGSATSTDARKSASVQETDLRPWAERFSPTNREELVVHKKKVSDVQNWLEKAFQGRERKLLILKGPSGAGKTATVATLAKDMGFYLSEWRNPVGSDYTSEGYVSMSDQFEEFLGRSGKYSGLELSGGARKTAGSPSIDERQGCHRKVILLEEFPNTVLSTSRALLSFRSCILEYLAANSSTNGSILSEANAHDVTPVIMVISESRLTTSSADNESFTAHRLLGSSILSHPGVNVIDFNPVATTLLTKALDLVILKEARQSSRRRIPGPSVLKKLGEVGDVRSAIGSLEFLCLRAEDDDDWGGRVASMAKKGSTTSSTVTKMERESLEMVTQRESSLGLFHAVGKVVYNKRDDASETLEELPAWRMKHVKSRVSQVSVDQLLNEIGTDTITFIAALHENYVLSCEGLSFTDAMSGCLDALCDSDLLSSTRGGRSGSSAGSGSRSFQGAASDSIRQEEICFQLAVRGLLFALPDPVKRKAHPIAGKVGGKGDTYKIFYPTSLRLSRQMEEVDELVDRWVGRLQIGVSLLNQHPKNRSLGKTISNSRDQTGSAAAEEDPHHPDHKEVEPVRSNLTCTKTELLLERLPYITQIAQRSPGFSYLHELEKITKLGGFDGLDGDALAEEEEEGPDASLPIADWTTEWPADMKPELIRSTHQQSNSGAKTQASTALIPDESQMEKLYLSDDDIED